MYLHGRASGHGAMGHRIDHSWWTHDWCNKGCGMCYPDGAYKRIIAYKVAHVVAAVGFISRYLNDPLPYVRRHITVNKMC